MKLLFVLLAGYASAALAIGVLAIAYRSQRAGAYLISDNPHRSKTDVELRRAVLLNMIVSIALIFGCTYGFYDFLFHERPIPAWRFVVEALTVILIYDFAYYFLHRYLFHEWRWLRGVHAVHHAARNPRVIDSLLLHPVETFLGLATFLGTIALVGGVHLVTFLALFTAYTAFNILNHSGVNVSRFPFKTLGILAAKHDRHHHSMLSGNYASITPLPDIIFGTVE